MACRRAESSTISRLARGPQALAITVELRFIDENKSAAQRSRATEMECVLTEG
jgi:hypothetical protein